MPGGNSRETRQFSGDLLAKQLESTPAYGLLVGGEFDHAKPQEDVAKVRKYYENLGYFDAKVEPQVFYSKNRKWISLHYKIQEGAQYKIGKNTVSGIAELATADFHEEFQKLGGRFFDSQLVNEVAMRIGDKVRERGYKVFNVEVMRSFQAGSGIVDINFRIRRNPRHKLQGAKVFKAGSGPLAIPLNEPGK